MTPEQLDEIENRQAAAMWIGGPTAAFAQDTLLLVKAARTLITERDEALAKAARLQEQVDWLLEGREQQEQRLALEVDE